MGLKNLGNNDYHVYEVNDNEITTFTADATTDECTPETVRNIAAVDAGIRKSFDEDSGSPAPKDIDGFQTGKGQELQFQMVGGNPYQLNALVGEQPIWEKEWTSVSAPGYARGSVTDLIREKYLTQTTDTLDLDHAGKIADRYLAIPNEPQYQKKINDSARAQLIAEKDGGSLIFKSYDFAYKTFRQYYGLDKIGPTNYWLTSEIWLNTYLITSKSGKGNFKVLINTKSGEQKICCKSVMFFNKKSKAKGLVAPSFNVRISEIIAGSDFDGMAALYLPTISPTNSSFTTWAQSAASDIKNWQSGSYSSPMYTAEDGFKCQIKNSANIPGSFGFFCAMSFGTVAAENDRPFIKFDKLEIGVNSQNAIGEILNAVLAQRGLQRARDAAQRAAQSLYSSQRKAASVASAPSTTTTDTAIDLDKPVDVALPTRPDIAAPTENTGGQGTQFESNGYGSVNFGD